MDERGKGELTMLLKALTKIAICVCIGAGLGWFVSYEWNKHHKKEVSEWKSIEPIKRPVKTDDIRVLNWAGKK